MFARFVRTFRHWLTPHTTNNFRAKLLHNSGWLSLIGIYFVFNIFVRILDSEHVNVLGFTSTITIDETVKLTNQERMANGLQPLKYNEVLADAARRKAANMFAEDYWAHNSPSGKSPWVWFQAAGYHYTNAGENLAKDFGSTDRMVAAWMASPTHRANIVNDKFQDIGIAVVPGTLQGKETVLVVQLFGTTAETGSVPASAATPKVAEVKGTSTAPAVAPVAKKAAAPNVTVEATPEPTLVPDSTPIPAPVMELKEFVAPPAKSVLMDEFSVKKAVSLFTTGLLILVLLADVLIAESRQLSRRVGKNWAHIVFINVILILVTIVNAGNII